MLVSDPMVRGRRRVTMVKCRLYQKNQTKKGLHGVRQRSVDRQSPYETKHFVAKRTRLQAKGEDCTVSSSIANVGRDICAAQGHI